MIAPAWQRRLDAASSPEGVLAIAREFVATFSTGDIERLPAFCRPGPLDSSKDVSDFAQRLSRHYFDGDAATARVLTRMVQFFSAAAVRLAEVVRAPMARDGA